MNRLISHALFFGFFFCFFLFPCVGQESQPDNLYQQAYPAIGWDSLKLRIIYPDLCNRAGVTGAYNAFLDIGSGGQILSSRIEPLNYNHVNNRGDSYFVSALKSAIHSTTWTPAFVKGKPVRSELTVPVMFLLRKKNVTRPIIIDADTIVIHKHITY